MSRQELETVIGRAILDETFRFALFADPIAALTGYALTEEELAALKAMDAESLDACGADLGLQITRRLAADDTS